MLAGLKEEKKKVRKKDEPRKPSWSLSQRSKRARRLEEAGSDMRGNEEKEDEEEEEKEEELMEG